MSEKPLYPIEKNEAEKRFELHVDGQIAFVDFMESPGQIVYTHTEVPLGLEGRGIGGQLARHVLDYARDNDLLVLPLCPFIAAYIRKHPEYREIVFPGKRRQAAADRGGK